MRQVITVVSPKGGVGKTFVSVNLAVSLALHSGFRVLLLDLDLHSGDAAVHLDLIGRPTLAELVPYAGGLEPAHLRRAVVTHEPSGLDVILAPARPEAAETAGSELVEGLLRAARPRYEFVLIDTPPDPGHPLVQRCLEEATSVLLVSSLDAAALRQCRLFLDGPAGDGARPQAGGDDLAGRLTLVLNQAHASGPLPAERAAAFLGAGSGGLEAYQVPEDRAGVERAVFDGRPLVLADPGHPVSRALYELADSYCPVFATLIGEQGRRRPGLRGLLEVLRRW